MREFVPKDDADWLMFELGGKHRSQVLSTLAALGVADELIAGPRDVEALAKALRCDAEDLESLVRAGAGLGVLREGPPRTFALTERGQQLRSDQLGSFAAYLGSRSQWDPWSRLRDGMRDDRTPFRLRFDGELYDYLRDNQEASTEYDAAIDAFTRHEATYLRGKLELADRKCLVDVGGGRGTLLRELLQEAPSARGVLYDLPHVIDAVRDQLPERVEAVAGDFFAEVPNGADVYLIKHVLHNWPDARAVQLLQNCREAKAKNGIVVVIDALLAPDNRPDLARMLDLEMRVLCGGRERRKPEFRRLIAEAGLTLQSAQELTSASWLFVAG